MQHSDNVNVYRERDITISQGDKVVFLKNDEGERGIGVVNGDSGIVKSIDQSGYVSVEVVKGNNAQEVSFNLGQYNNIDLAHAITSFKSQGSSIDHVIVSGDPRQENYNDMYVALTRGKEDATVYTPDVEALKEAISVEQVKASTLDYDKEVQEMRDNLEKESMSVPTPEMANTVENVLDKDILPETLVTEKSDISSPVDYDKETADMKGHLENESGAVVIGEQDNDFDAIPKHDQDTEQDQEKDLEL